MLQSGDIISGMYQVIREIGTGGMGVIYIGYHLHLQKQIVIKKIKETCVDRVNVRGEADILKQLRHTYLPQVYDFLEVGNDVYTVMDYIPGENLQYYIDHNYTFPEETILLWMLSSFSMCSRWLDLWEGRSRSYRRTKNDPSDIGYNRGTQRIIRVNFSSLLLMRQRGRRKAVSAGSIGR